jgi:hypothetical protein
MSHGETFTRGSPQRIHRPAGIVPGYSQLAELVGAEAAYAWACTLPWEVKYSPTAYTEAIYREIDRLLSECRCSPDGSGSACQVCTSATNEEELRFS